MEKEVILRENIGNKNWSIVLQKIFVFLVLPPVVGIPICISQIYTKRNASKIEYYAFFLCVATYLAAINSTKTVDGDQVRYFFAYQDVPYVGFIGSLMNIYGHHHVGIALQSISGEFMNGVFNFFGYYLTFGYYPLYAALLTIMMYMATFMGMYYFCKTLEKPHSPIVAGCLILGFFYLFFNFSLQLQKQMLAQSIMMYVIGKCVYQGKMNRRLWVIAIISVFTHQSMLLFIPFLYFKRFHQRLNKKSLIMLSVVGFAAILFGPLMAETATSSFSESAFSYGAKRFASSESNNDGLVMSWTSLPVMVISYPIIFIAVRKLWIERRSLSDSNALLLNIVAMMIIAIVAMFRQPTAQYRYFIMLQSFLPFVYPFITKNTFFRDKILMFLSLAIISWFYIAFEGIYWTYAPESHIVGLPPAYLIIANYPGY